MKDTKGVRQVLEDYGEKVIGLMKDMMIDNPIEAEKVADTIIDETVATLQEIMLGMLPEEAPLDIMGRLGSPYYNMTIAERKVRNATIKLIEQNIRGGFRSE